MKKKIFSVFCKNEYKKAALLLGYVFASCVLVAWWQPSYLVSILIILGAPALLNFLWLKKTGKKVLIFSLLTLLFFAPPIELMSRSAEAWSVATLFPEIMGYIPIENMLFAFLNFFWVLCFYEYFINKERVAEFSSRFKILFGLYAVLFLTVFSLFFYNPEIVAMDYYVIAVPVLVIPFIVIFSFFPCLIKKIIIPTLFFALVFFVYEMIALQLGYWWWPGDYVYSFSINGKIFPLDDVLIWYFLSTPVLIGGYEIFVNGLSKKIINN